MNLGKLKPDLNTEELVRKRANAEVLTPPLTHH